MRCAHDGVAGWIGVGGCRVAVAGRLITGCARCCGAVVVRRAG